MTSDQLRIMIEAMEAVHPESAKVTVGSRTPTGKVTNNVVVRYLKRKHHVIIEGYEETKRPQRAGRGPAAKIKVQRSSRGSSRRQ